MMQFDVRGERWPLAQAFTISRGTKTSADVVICTLSRDGHTGHGESMPYPRYGESVEQVIAQLEALRPRIEFGLQRADLPQHLPAGSARNALDCALWDLEAKSQNQPAYKLAELRRPQPVKTAYTISLDTAENMGRAAAANAERPLLKIKLAGQGDLERVEAIRQGAPDAALIVDANEGWERRQVEPFAEALAQRGVVLVEQPLPVGKDYALSDMAHPLPFCADESCHTAADLSSLAGRYEYVNIKLDKTGGLTEAIALLRQARQLDMGIMIGCMVATSLSMAPAALLASEAEFVDLDGPLLLENDRQPSLRYESSTLYPPTPDLWG